MRAFLGISMVVVLLSSCAPTRYPPGHKSAPQPSAPYSNSAELGAGGVVKRGKPYQVAGKWYYPLSSGAEYVATGTASWYGKKFHGRKTANGETYNMYAMTAAHTILPMPSVVLVTNLDNGKSVKVRVNDRGPFVKDRLIDLSYAAAKALGYAERGTARVRVQTLDTLGAKQPPRPMPKSKSASIYTQFIQVEDGVAKPISGIAHAAKPAPKVEKKTLKLAYIQVGAFAEKGNADGVVARLKQDLRASHPPLKVIPVGPIYRVRVGPFDLDEDAAETLSLLHLKGYEAAMFIHD